MTPLAGATRMRVAVLGLAAALSLRGPVAALRAARWTEADTLAASTDAALRRVRPSPGERVGFLVPAFDSDTDEVAMWYAAQYALAPALVEPVLLRECASPGGARCRVAPSSLVIAPFTRPDLILYARRRLGLTAFASSGDVILMRAPAEAPR